MYKKILVALDHTHADQSLLPHVTGLARLTGAQLVLIHVATGWVAYWGRHLNVEESEEIRADQAYLDQIAEKLKEEGFSVKAMLMKGQPHREILKIAQSEGCDLIALTTHGHRFIYDTIIGSTIDKLRHETEIPLLVVRTAPQHEE
jgi:nucleotide-binding universal stress UspA family protein